MRNVALLFLIAVDAEGYRENLGVVECAKVNRAGSSLLLKHLKEMEFYPAAGWQSCVVPSGPSVGAHPAGNPPSHARSACIPRRMINRLILVTHDGLVLALHVDFAVTRSARFGATSPHSFERQMPYVINVLLLAVIGVDNLVLKLTVSNQPTSRRTI